MDLRRRLRVLIAVGVVIGATASPAWACGGMVSDNGSAELTSMTAALSFDGSQERLLVQVGFGGATGESFGWLMPVPAAPEIEPADDSVLDAALTATTPPVRDDYVPSLLPGLCACGGGGEGAAGGVQHLGTTVVGDVRFDTIAGRAGALSTYLDNHNFELDAHQRDAVTDYVRRGWVFVTGTVADGAPAAGRITPVLFTFQTDEAVYPLEMAGDDAHPGDVAMDVITVTPYRPTSTTYDEHVLRPDPDGAFVTGMDSLGLVYSAPVTDEQRRALAPLTGGTHAWLSRYRANWSLGALTDDLVLAEGPSTRIDYVSLLASYRSDARWVNVGRFAFAYSMLLFLVLGIGGVMVILVGLARNGFKRRV
ncbi:MAG TPA: DUF2330 domain-containing protein [Actinomycetota bacterium]|nr:DUF2330 domain-containing protein [Actinomycetota bacterium]